MASPIDEVAPKLEQKVAAFVKEHRLPGASCGVVVGDELAWSHGYGFADLATKRPHDATTLFRIASITKTFTATAILQLRDEGEAASRRPGRRLFAGAARGDEPVRRDRDGDDPPHAVA